MTFRARSRHRLIVDRGFHPRGRYGYRRHFYYDWYNPVRASEEVWQANLKRWKATGPSTRADATSVSASVHAAWYRQESFRLVDGHGRVYGQRYTPQRGLPRSPIRGEREYPVTDGKGNAAWMKESTRVRIVNKQPEDYHSAACRALKRAHRLGLES